MPPAHLPPMRWTRHASSGCSDICEQKKDGTGTHSFSPSRSGALGREQGDRVKPGQSHPYPRFWWWEEPSWQSQAMGSAEAAVKMLIQSRGGFCREISGDLMWAKVGFSKKKKNSCAVPAIFEVHQAQAERSQGGGGAGRAHAAASQEAPPCTRCGAVILITTDRIFLRGWICLFFFFF